MIWVLSTSNCSAVFLCGNTLYINTLTQRCIEIIRRDKHGTSKQGQRPQILSWKGSTVSPPVPRHCRSVLVVVTACHR